MSDHDLGLLICYVLVHVAIGFMLLVDYPLHPFDRIIRKGPTRDARKFLKLVCFLFWPVIAIYYLKYLGVGICRFGRWLLDCVVGMRDIGQGALDMLPKRTNVPKAKVVKRANVP